ncbi:XRE family transcriptional regulator [Pseudooceanicola nanhaiensis]|jgi:transcriptional regulator with XRE-family HTH domain|uniref:XRE family transcriptional regulator n=1 Tax=Pseudooceanicola nanhaiensis TaxID=375761 RepID=A0A917SJ39_9RHOB|nr:helix-turn-helix domain-containing protein [Pseudooceanicola nanhaiensis]GGL84981.1 XRE family transcriptional regulator [Pseudooceanicola nanhaiensis]
MGGIIDKRARARAFRQRLERAMQTAGMSQSGLARAIGVDRSTVSQLLKDEGARLPNAQVIGECAGALGVSADWLLSLSDRPETATDLLATSLTLTEAPRALVDQQIFEWHREAAGYKVRHVPAALPDMLKLREVLEWEYSPHLGRTTSQAIGASEDRLRWMREARSDYEIAMPLHEMVSFAHGESYYRGLPRALRKRQVERFIELNDTLYPRLRLYLFDARRIFSAPVTVFGPLLAVVYAGRHYLAFRDSLRVQAFTEHFDNLVREASVPDREIKPFLARLARDI